MVNGKIKGERNTRGAINVRSIIHKTVFEPCVSPSVLAGENVVEMAEKAGDDEDDSSDSGDEDEGVITEIRFVPSDKVACE